MNFAHTAVAGAVCLSSAGAVFGQSQPHWRAMPGLNGEGTALLVTSGSEAGGNGVPALWVAGNFTQLGTLPAGRAARLNGGGGGVWQSVGSFDFTVKSLCEHDGGSGQRVYAGGFFNIPGVPPAQLDCVGSFDGAAWHGLGVTGYSLSWCNAIASYQLPGQPAKLFVSGSPSGSNNYARAVSGAGWEDVGGEFLTISEGGTVYDDGSGPEFFTLNGTATGINKFNGVRRATLGGSCFSTPRCFLPFGEGAARVLVAGGNLTNTGGVQVAGVSAWNGTTWSGLGGNGWGVRKSNGAPGWVHKLVKWDDGSGEKLWAIGFFDSVGGPTPDLRVPAQNVAAWDGVLWSVPALGGITGVPADGSFINGAETAAVFDFDGAGGRPPSLVVAGKFTGAGGVAVSNFAVLEAAWCGVADVGRQGGLSKPDGVLDNNDFVAFIDLFFESDLRADLGVQGGLSGHDGQFDNNDFIVFIAAFFDGCAG